VGSQQDITAISCQKLKSNDCEPAAGPVSCQKLELSNDKTAAGHYQYSKLSVAAMELIHVYDSTCTLQQWAKLWQLPGSSLAMKRHVPEGL
jgi:hypothetical protein